MSDTPDQPDKGRQSLEDLAAEFRRLHAQEHGADIATLWRAVRNRIFRNGDTDFIPTEVSVNERIARGHLLYSVVVAGGSNARAIGMGRDRKEAVNEAMRKAAAAPLADYPDDVQQTTADGAGSPALQAALDAVGRRGNS